MTKLFFTGKTFSKCRPHGAAALIQCGDGRQRENGEGDRRQEEIIRDGHGYRDLVSGSRASAQTSYEWIMDGQHQTPENLDSDSPMVKLIKSAMDTMKNNLERGFTSGPLNSKEELKKQTWFQGFEDQLDDALKPTEELYQQKG